MLSPIVSRSQTLVFAQGRYRLQYKRPARKGSGISHRVLANLRTGLDLRTGPPRCENSLRTGLDECMAIAI